MLRRWRMTGQPNAEPDSRVEYMTRLQHLAHERELRRHATSRPIEAVSPARRQRMSQIADNSAAIAEWLQQIKSDRSGLQLKRLLNSDTFGVLFWAMRDEGEQWRAEVVYALDVGEGNYSIHRDPREKVPFTRQTLLFKLAQMAHVQILPIDEQVRAYIAEFTSAHVSACIQTYPDKHALLFIQQYVPWVDAAPDEKRAQYERWVWQAAQVLGQYVMSPGLYAGPMAPAALILPPDPQREPTDAAVYHQWAKAFLNLKGRCVVGSMCPCNYVIDTAATAPVRYPEHTDALILTEIDRAHERELTPPPGQVHPSHPSRPSEPLHTVDDDPDLDPNWRGPDR